VFGQLQHPDAAWVDRGTDGARTLWDLQALRAGRGMPAPGTTVRASACGR
jgi:hypothetical protein